MKKNWLFVRMRRETLIKACLMMKFALVILMLSVMQSRASVYSQLVRMDVKLKNATLKEVMIIVKQNSDFSFVYSDLDLKNLVGRDISLKNVTVDKVLQECLKGTDLEFDIVEKTIIIKKNENQVSAPQSKVVEVSGVVKDKQGNMLPGVTIRLKGTNVGTASDIDGNFSIPVPPSGSVLVLTFVGMKTKEVPVGNKTSLSIVLEDEAEVLDEVVVTGMGARKKEGYTGAAVTVKGEDLKKFSTNNIARALSVIDPGFRIMDNIMSGSDPNRLPDLRMRGQATLPSGSGASDAIMMKGEYSTFPNQPLLIMDGFEISLQVFSDLDPERVETITLLKDAAATAIYGSKAANGVIVIETKAPAMGTLRVSYNGNVRVEMPDLSAYNLMNAAEKLEVERIAGYYPEDADISYMQNYQHYLREVQRGVNTYWLSQPLRTGVQQRHALAFEGGDRALRYRLYVGINMTPGVMKGSERQTLTGTLDLSYRFKKVLLKNSITVDDAKGVNSPYGSFSEYTRLNPYLRPYDEHGNIQKDIQIFNMPSGGQETILNPLYNTTFKSKNQNSSFGIRNLFKVEYNLLEEIKLEGEFSLSKNVNKTEVFKPAQHTDFNNEKDPTKKGSFRMDQGEGFSYSLDLTGSYNNTFNSLHYLTALFRMSVQESSSQRFGAVATGFPNDNMDNILFGKRYNEQMSGSEGTSRTIGWVGSFGYSYDYRYSMDFNIRVDGSSQFGRNNRFAPFWSGGLRWNIKKESWFKNVEFISDMTLRGSYGVTGTQGFPAYQSQQVYTYANLLQPYLASDGTGVELVGLGNPDLKWQKTNQTNVALELSLLKNRITTRLEYYQKVTMNQLTDISLAPSIGFSSFSENMGTIENKGIEFTFSVIPYRNPSKDALWSITLNGSHNTDKLTKISDALREMNERNASEKSATPLPRYEEGESLNRIWAVKSLGIAPATGVEVFQKRLTNEVTNIYDPVDVAPCGTTEPKLQGNINSSFTYKGFEANISFNYKVGGQTYNSTLADKVENADLRYNADKRVLDLRWKNPGDKVFFKALVNAAKGSDTGSTSRFVVDENVIRCTALSIGYRMTGENVKFLKDSFISSMAVYFNTEDLFYLSTVKEERGLDYPFARQFAISLSMAF